MGLRLINALITLRVRMTPAWEVNHEARTGGSPQQSYDPITTAAGTEISAALEHVFRQLAALPHKQDLPD
jgi:hypothetical protein